MNRRTGLISLLTLAACVAATTAEAQQPRKPRGQQPQQEQPKGPPQPEKQFPNGVQWALEEINGKPPPAAADATLKIDNNNRGTGGAGCNSWSSPMVAIPGQRLAMGAIALTKRTCPAEIMAFERTYLTILHSGPTWDLVVTDLVVKAGNFTLKFRRGL